MKTVIKNLMLASSLSIAVAAHAAVGLERVGPNDTDNGYPLWYQDTSGLALDLCIPKHAGQDDACLTTPVPGDPANAFPFAFPANWPDELFWYGADALLDLDGNRAILVQAIEAAFGGAGTPNPGGQISFSRIRIRFDAPYAGDYTVKYPYETVSFTGVAAGEPIFYTVDIGIGAPGDFSGAMGGEIGPFLTAVDSAGTPKPLFSIPDNDGTGNVSTFLSDPGLTTEVTGSPIAFNSFEIEVVASNPVESRVWTTNQFSLIGKVHATPIGSPMQVTSAVYSRPLAGGDVFVDVHATAVSGPGATGDPILTLGMLNQPSAIMSQQFGTTGKYFGQATIAGTAALPNGVTVINSSDNPASSVTVPLVDRVTITNATIDLLSGMVNIEATSSDTTVTQLFVDINGSPVAFAPPSTAIATGITIAPESLTVSSSAGGTTTASLVILCNGCRAGTGTGAPLAADDVQFCINDITGCTLDILSNDGNEADPATIALVSDPVNGTVSVLGGLVTYSPNSAGATVDGVIDSFVYTVDSLTVAGGTGGLSSNQATVTINPNGAQPLPPVVTPPGGPAEELSVARSECRAGKNEWRVDGASTLLSAHSVTVYGGSTVVGGAIIAANVQVDNLGTWSIPRNSGSCAFSTISIESSQGAVLEGVSVNIR
jgi:hypothetical protein